MPSPDDIQAATNDDGRLFPLTTRPGIKRDGTLMDGNQWVSGQHTRFSARGRARKMGGYRSISPYFDGPIRKMLLHPHSGHNHLICGSASSLQVVDVTSDGIGTAVVDITPSIADGFVPDNNNTWQFASLYDSVALGGKILAHAAPNLATIDSEVDRKIWFGTDDAPLTDTTAPQVSGGILAAAPYAIAYGNDGYVAWCVPNLPDDWIGAGSGSARVTEHKIVYGKKIRGGSGQSPAFLLWSLDAVLRATFIGGVPTFGFDTIAEEVSILSSASVIEYNGLIYWAGVDGFYVYNGVVDELQNDMNLDYFFEGLTWEHRQKVWATKIPRFGEIWWFYPRDGATECNAAIIYNKHLNTWYDTMLPRSAGVHAKVFRWPVWAGVDRSTTTFVRPRGGTPTTTASGSAQNAFDDNALTDCAQISADGAIGYDYGLGVTKTIKKVGIMSAVDITYNLVFEKSNDMVTWEQILAPGSLPYLASNAVVYVLQQEHTARAFRVRETGGAVLDLAEFYIYAYGYMIHQHEFGYDRIVGNDVQSIRAYIESGNVAYSTTGALGDRWLGVDAAVRLIKIEPDLRQSGDVTISIIGRNFPNSPDDTSSFTSEEGAEFHNRDTQRRNMRIRFQSDAQNGFFELGETRLKIAPGDET